MYDYVAGVVTRARLMQQRPCVARAHGARGARCALLTTLVGVLWETALQVPRHGVRYALPYIIERAARPPAFGFHCSCAYLSLSAALFLCRLSASLSAPLSLRLSPRTLSLCFSPDRRVCHHLSLRLSLSSYRPRLHWRSRQKSTTTLLQPQRVCQRLPAYLWQLHTRWWVAAFTQHDSARVGAFIQRTSTDFLTRPWSLDTERLIHETADPSTQTAN